WALATPAPQSAVSRTKPSCWRFFSRERLDFMDSVFVGWSDRLNKRGKKGARKLSGFHEPRRGFVAGDDGDDGDDGGVASSSPRRAPLLLPGDSCPEVDGAGRGARGTQWIWE